MYEVWKLNNRTDVLCRKQNTGELASVQWLDQTVHNCQAVIGIQLIFWLKKVFDAVICLSKNEGKGVRDIYWHLSATELDSLGGKKVTCHETSVSHIVMSHRKSANVRAKVNPALMHFYIKGIIHYGLSPPEQSTNILPSSFRNVYARSLV
jgi:hypothetical protein